ncbi:MAG: hypothetical protein HOP19_14965 [Acidobacteria bacterium]|nr:hypothetical protein [Acidobacteriota bacterium]
MVPAVFLWQQALRCCLITTLLTGAALAQQQNVLPEAPRKPTVEPVVPLAPYRPITTWQDQRFIFLSSPKASSDSPYQDFNGKRLRKDYAGRIVKVVNVSDFSGRQHLDLEMEDNGEKLRARTSPNRESLEGLLLLDDLEQARKRWEGQTLWSRQMRLSTYDEANDALGSLAIKRYAALKVVSVTPGWDNAAPLRFTLETTDGKRGFMDVNLSGTNVPPELRQLSRFEDQFLTENPRLKYKWPAATWAVIESNRIVSGMTAEQVKMSWGEPQQTARTATGEVWTYSNGKLVFNKTGVLVSW